MSVDLRTLADLKRFLATPGATIQAIRHDFKDSWTRPDRIAQAMEPKTVSKLQTNAARFSDEVWLYWDKGKSKTWSFDGDTFTIRPPDGGDRVITYRCWIDGARP